jgi:hypothetical protein
MEAYQSPTIPAHTLIFDCCWCLHSILSAITHRLNVSGHMLIWTFFACFCTWNSRPKFVRTFQLYPVYFLHLQNRNRKPFQLRHIHGITTQQTTEAHMYLLTYGAEPSLRSRKLCSHSRTSQHFMEPEGSLPCSQEPSIGPYPEPDLSTHTDSCKNCNILQTYRIISSILSVNVLNITVLRDNVI